MNKFVNIAKFSMVSALTAGLTIGTVVESAEALVRGGGWGIGTVTNGGDDPNIPEQQNLGFGLLRGKNSSPISGNSRVFEGAIENFFYKDSCENACTLDDNDDNNDDNNLETFKLSFGVGDLKATLNNDNTAATYEILSNELILEANNEVDTTTIDNPNNQPFVAAEFTLDISPDDNPDSFVKDLDTIVGEFYNQFFMLKPGKNGDSPEDFDQINGINKLSGDRPEIKPFPPNGLTINFQGEKYTIESRTSAPNSNPLEGDIGTLVINEIPLKEPVKTTPEPGNIFSLLALGSLGVGALHRRKIRINSNK